jgi:hypothetical protein
MAHFFEPWRNNYQSKIESLHENFNIVYMEQEDIITNVKKLVCKNEYKLIHVIVHLHVS